MGDKEALVIICLIIGCLIGYFFTTDKCKISINELNDLEIKYTNLNNSYNQLRVDYSKLRESYNALQIENQQLRNQQKQLSEQIATYLAEQAVLDWSGLKKYAMAYDIIKIAICNKNPTMGICY
jgi:FtsZ-binding cell division protein ZapB